MTTFWIVVGVLVVAALAAMLVHDRRAKARGSRFDADGIGGGATGSPEAYRSSPGSHPTGWGRGTGGGAG
ncbi:hypothetical protein ASG36_13030 [Geodermatophilus sp. Leaf369]|uniref:hypothetical protein n=1 Tax=Geodermatophilus sp. Leaf369 TaxID=1736354 RepID=UPI0006F53244|nr:hypothetical protein [Geodermatophilus sp. Leaf369]KQS58894.1 hypothetical protein ASG36_13030 [Geodermatophilus sp. Leaf369]